jgi:hypothetical protein
MEVEMRSKHYRVPMYGTTIAAALLLGAAAAVPAAAAADATPIGPKEYFTGLVNGASERAAIKVACPSVGSDRTGHPVAGQTVAVTSAPVTSNTAGYTGDSATGIVVEFGVSSTSTPLVLRAYDTRAEIPTSLTLPCDGTGKVVFAPAPTSNTARSSSVEVTYEGFVA